MKTLLSGIGALMAMVAAAPAFPAVDPGLGGVGLSEPTIKVMKISPEAIFNVSDPLRLGMDDLSLTLEYDCACGGGSAGGGGLGAISGGFGGGLGTGGFGGGSVGLGPNGGGEPGIGMIAPTAPTAEPNQPTFAVGPNTEFSDSNIPEPLTSGPPEVLMIPLTPGPIPKETEDEIVRQYGGQGLEEPVIDLIDVGVGFGLNGARGAADAIVDAVKDGIEDYVMDEDEGN